MFRSTFSRLAYQLFRLTIVLTLIQLSACSSGSSGSVTANSGSMQGAPLPVALTSLPSKGNLSAYISVDNGQRQKMDISGGTASINLPGISEGAHLITIEFEYVLDAYPNQPLTLASASKALDVVSGQANAVSFSTADYDTTSHDADGDKESNLSELANHTNPFSPVDVSTLSFAAATNSVKESVGGVGLSIVLDQAPAYDISLSYSVGGSATGGGVDHSLTSGTLLIPAGQTSASIDFTVVDDSIVEGDEDVVVTLDSATDGLVGAQNTETVTITDNDATLGGTVTGLANNAVLTLKYNGGDAIQITGTGADQSFTFPTPIDNTIGYQVTSILPFSANEICGVANGNGGAVSANVTNVTVSCVPNTGEKMSGFYQMLVVQSDGTLWAWGDNTNGPVGDGTQVQRHAPVQIGTDNHWASVAAGFGHSVALKTDGTLWTWGYNAFGELGDGTTNDHYAPVQVGTATDWIYITAGAFHTAALRKDGAQVTLWAWGKDNYGQLGDSNDQTTKVDPSQHSPIQIGLATDWVSISAGGDFTTGLRSDGTYTTLYTWGRNSYGQLGDGHDPNASLGEQFVSTPQLIGSATDHWVSVSASGSDVAALRSDGTNVTLWAWGNNDSGQLGDGSDPALEPYVYVPKQIGTRTDWIRVVASAWDTLAIASNGTENTLWIWGDNTSGVIGPAFDPATVLFVNTPTQVGTLTNWSDIETNRGGHMHARGSDGTLWSWGANGFGTSGDGTVTDKAAPVQIGTSTSFLYHTVGGTVSGLASGNTLTLQNDDNSGNPVTVDVTADGAFVFVKGYTANTPYAVTIVSNTPTSQTCTLSNQAGTDTGTNITNVTVTCTP